MLPTWGNYWSDPDPIFTPENAKIYGEFLGERYTGKPIIWILGGMRISGIKASTRSLKPLPWIEKGDRGEHLITYHPRGPGLSSDYLHEETWLDFNMYQSSMQPTTMTTDSLRSMITPSLLQNPPWTGAKV